MNWFDRKIDKDALLKVIGNDLREFALLWLLFSILDMLIENKLTIAWLLVNGFFSLAMWSFGTYLNVRK